MSVRPNAKRCPRCGQRRQGLLQPGADNPPQLVDIAIQMIVSGNAAALRRLPHQLGQRLIGSEGIGLLLDNQHPLAGGQRLQRPALLGVIQESATPMKTV